MQDTSDPSDGAWQSLLQNWSRGDIPGAVEAARSHPILQSLESLLSEQGPIVIAQLGQSLDGRIAAADGSSRYINGKEALAHLHRLRALVDAVVVGAGTVAADNPRLTVRRVEGANPCRVVIDPRGRLANDLTIFTDPSAPTLRLVGNHTELAGSNCVECSVDKDGHIGPSDILDLLKDRGLSRVLIEGGSRTVGTFLEAGLLSRLHVMVGPIILGAGPVGINLGSINSIHQALRPRVAAFQLGPDVLFDCAFTAD